MLSLFPLPRDLDSRLSDREWFAVSDWLSVGSRYHVMRDNRYHGAPVLGGMFGMRLDAGNRRAMAALFAAFVKGTKREQGKGTDQAVLGRDLWPRIKDDVTSHDSYLCK